MGLIRSAKEFVKDVLDTIQRKTSKEENQIAERFFEERKKDVLNAIKQHPISQELRNFTVPSSFLSGVNASLYGFMGFYAGTKPVDIILDITNAKMKYKVRKKLFKRGMTIDIIFPTLEDYRVPSLVLPWHGGFSAVDSLEKGISGLSYYIRTNSVSSRYSRSRQGLQAKSPVRVAEYRGRPYLSAIFEKAISDSKAFKF